MQLAAVRLLDPAHVHLEKVCIFLIHRRGQDADNVIQVALQKHFKQKRDHVLKRLKEIGLEVDLPPCSTFYIWLNLEKLPQPLNNGLVSLLMRNLFFNSNSHPYLKISRLSSRNYSKRKPSSSLASSLTSILLIDAIYSIRPAIISSVSRSDPLLTF